MIQVNKETSHMASPGPVIRPIALLEGMQEREPEKGTRTLHTRAATPELGLVSPVAQRSKCPPLLRGWRLVTRKWWRGPGCSRLSELAVMLEWLQPSLRAMTKGAGFGGAY